MEGRDPSSLQLVVRANLEVSDEPLGKNRWSFAGSVDQMKEDIEACRDVGADELFFDPIFSRDADSLDRFLKRMEQMREIV